MAERVVKLRITADPTAATRAGQALVSAYSKVAQDVNRQLGQINRLDGLREGAAAATAQVEKLRDKMRGVANDVIAANGSGAQLANLRQMLVVQEKLAEQRRKQAEAESRYAAAGAAGIQGTNPNRTQAAELFKAADAVSKQRAETERLVAVENALSASLREAGVNLADVANEQQRLNLAAAQVRPLTTQYAELTRQLGAMETAINRDTAAAAKLNSTLSAQGAPTGPGAAGALSIRLGAQNLFAGVAAAAEAEQARATAKAIFIIEQAARAARAKASQEKAELVASARNLFRGVAEAAAAEQARARAAAANLFGGIAQVAQARVNASQSLGVRPFADLRGEIAQIERGLAVYRQLRATGSISFNEMAAASNAARVRIAALKAEMGGVLQRLKAIRAASGGGIGGIGGIGAGLGGLTGVPALAGGVAAAYGAGEFISGSVKTALEFDAIERALTAVTGSAVEAEDSLKFVREEVERLGIPLGPAADGFKRLAASAKGSGIELATVKELFSGLTEAAVALGLDQNRLQGIFEAFGQIMSKGKVQAEELRGQLGDRLYGAFSLAARGMGLTTEALDEALKKGDVLAKEFINRLIPILESDFGAAAETASQSARASFGRLQTAVTELQLAFANSGLLDDLADAANVIADKFRDPEFVDSVRALGQTFGQIASFVANHGATLLRIFAAMIAAKTGMSLGAAIGTVVGGPAGTLVGGAVGAVAGGAAGFFAADALISEPTGEGRLSPRERLAQLQAETNKLAENYAYLKSINQEHSSYAQNALALIQKNSDAMRSLLGVTPDGEGLGSRSGGAGDVEAIEKAAKAARAARQQMMQHFNRMVAEEDRRLIEQAELKRQLHIETLEAQGQDSQAALAKLRDQHDEHLKVLGDSAEGLDLANKWFNASEAGIALTEIRERAERELKAIQDRIAARDRRSEFASPDERRRLQQENARDAALGSGILSDTEAAGSPFGGATDRQFNEFLDGAREGVEDLALSIRRATEGPITQMFREWQDGTLRMEEAGARWIDATVSGIARMVSQGKFDFRSLAESIIEDIIRIQLQSAVAGFASGGIGQAFGNYLGGLFTGGTNPIGVPSSFTGGGFGSGAGLSGFADGGAVYGPGSATSDSILARLSNGEFVMNARAVRLFGRDTFEALNRGFVPGTQRLPRFAEGGYVGGGVGGMAGNAGTLVQVINATGAPVREETTRGPGGMEIKRILIGSLTDDLTQNGPISRLLQRSYGLNNRPGVR